MQNFRAKDRTAMRTADDLATQEYAAAVAVTRLVLGPRVRLQAPPNLADPTELGLLVRAGIDDWGGVSPLTPDHVNPERPWPHVDDLARLTAEAGFTLRERLTAHPHYVRAGEPWIDPRVAAARRGRSRTRRPRRRGSGPGRAGRGRSPTAQLGLVRQGRPARRDRHRRPHGRPPRRLRRGLRRLAGAARGGARRRAVHGRGRRGRPRHPGSDAAVRAALLRAESDPAGLTDAEYLTLFSAEGADLEALTLLADRVRRTSTATS